MTLDIKDVRAEMPNYENYKEDFREREILGVAVHHSASASRATGAPIGNALTFFNYHVNVRGWKHGGYNYVITGDGTVEYALDERIAAFHAGFRDPDDSEGLEEGQYWNNHYLAICVAGNFTPDRTYIDANGETQSIPNEYIEPTEAQWASLLGLIAQLREKYGFSVENVRGHRELRGNLTSCPGANFSPAEIRQRVATYEPEPAPPDPNDIVVVPGEHVMLLPDTDRYLQSSMAYVWKFRPDVSFAVDEARGRWKYVTAVGSKTDITDDQLSRLRSGGAILVQRISGEPTEAQETLDDLMKRNKRFLDAEDGGVEPPPPEQTYTVQPGDSLFAIARKVYNNANLWRTIFEANRNILSDPSKLRPGQVLVIPPQPT